MPATKNVESEFHWERFSLGNNGTAPPLLVFFTNKPARLAGRTWESRTRKDLPRHLDVGISAKILNKVNKGTACVRIVINTFG